MEMGFGQPGALARWRPATISGAAGAKWEQFKRKHVFSNLRYEKLFRNDPEKPCRMKDLNGESGALYEYMSCLQEICPDRWDLGTEKLERREHYEKLYKDFQEEYRPVREEGVGLFYMATELVRFEYTYLSSDGTAERIVEWLIKGADIFHGYGEEAVTKYGHLKPEGFSEDSLQTSNASFGDGLDGIETFRSEPRRLGEPPLIPVPSNPLFGQEREHSICEHFPDTAREEFYRRLRNEIDEDIRGDEDSVLQDHEDFWQYQVALALERLLKNAKNEKKAADAVKEEMPYQDLLAELVHPREVEGVVVQTNAQEAAESSKEIEVVQRMYEERMPNGVSWKGSIGSTVSLVPLVMQIRLFESDIKQQI